VRTALGANEWVRFVARPGVRGPVGPFRLAGGIGTFYRLNKTIADHLEIRPFQGIAATWPNTRRLRLQHYLRLEERFEWETADWTLAASLRTRYRLQLDYSFSGFASGSDWRVVLHIEGFLTLADPTDTELQGFFQERQEEYRVPPRISFSHVYFNTDRRGRAAEQDARRALAELRAATMPPERAPERGDRFMLQYDYALRSPREVQQAFGAQFAETLFELEPGWHGPVVSGYGIHLVYISERVDDRIPEYEEVRDRLVIDYNRMRRDRANELLYEGLVSGYEIEIDEEALQRAALRLRSGAG
jgi:hypothetical protein